MLVQSTYLRSLSIACGSWSIAAKFAVITWICICIPGCQFAPKAPTSLWPWKKDEAKPLPDRILAVWTESILHQSNQPGVRGFGGRVYFYSKDGTDPVEVDGSLAIYVFDADDLAVTNQKPLRKFIFTAEQFATHMSRTSIGISYSVWLPWGEVGGPPRRLSLIARFEGQDGGTVISDPTIKLLPGVAANGTKESIVAASDKGQSSDSSGVTLAGHKARQEDSEIKTALFAEGSDVKTIDLPPTFQRHLRSSDKPENARSVAPLSVPSVPHFQVRPEDGTPKGITEMKLEADTAELNGTATASEPSVTTQVFDYRTKNRGRPSSISNGEPSKKDIRTSHSIKSITRDHPNNSQSK